MDAVFHHYAAPYQPQQIALVESQTGLSGASIWRVHAPVGLLSLRRWPAEHPDSTRLAWIHSVLRHVQHHGCRLVPVPLPTRDGTTFVVHADRLWELAPWIAGKALESSQVTPTHVAGAFAALAQFHRAAATFTDVVHREGVAPAILQRLEITDRWLHRGGADLIEKCASKADSAVAVHCSPLLAALRQQGPEVESQLRGLANSRVDLQPCIRDIHNHHVLFESNQVAGLIDFGAMRIDSIATDVARLLGTMAGDDSTLRTAALAEYQSLRPLSENELRLIDVIDRANVVLSGPQWLQWLLVEGKTFPLPSVLARLQTIRERLG